MVSTSNICLRCFSYNHKRSACTGNKVICCSKCYRINYLTRNCCELQDAADETYYQGFRMVGNKKTRFFIDIQIGTRMFPALLNTNLCRSIIDEAVQEYITENSILYNMSMFNEISTEMIFGQHKITLQFEVTKLPGDILIVLGQDFLEPRKAQLFLNGVIINPKMSFINRRYITDVKIYGKNYKAIIDTSISTAKISREVFEQIIENKDDNILYDENNTVLHFMMSRPLMDKFMLAYVTEIGSDQIHLGIDWLKEHNFSFQIDGVQLHLNNPWKTIHQDSIQFAYNHEKGYKLRDLLIINRYPLEADYKRPSLSKK